MKYDFKKRRAVKCEFVEKSKTSPGYLKYEVTICEKDGIIAIKSVVSIIKIYHHIL